MILKEHSVYFWPCNRIMWAAKALKNLPKLLANVRFASGKAVGIIGVPFDKGAGTRGADLGPQALRHAGLLDELRHMSADMDVKDYGNIHYEVFKASGRRINNLNHLEHVAACNEALAHKIKEIMSDNRLPVTLGGDHSLAIGSITGVLKTVKPENVCVLWIDAHIDLNTNSTSPSGNMHGMPVSLLVQELRPQWPTLPVLEWCKAQLSLKNFSWIGLRSIDYDERIMMEKYGINYFDMRDIEKLGIEKVVKQALEAINPSGEKSLHVSFDIDALDPLYANSTGTPVAGGLTLREGVFVMEEAYRTGKLSSLDLVEVNPSLGDAKDVTNTISAAKLLIQAALGSNRSGNR